MHTSLRIITRATLEPLSLDEVKQHLSIDDSDSDERLSALIIAARQHVENMTNRAIPTQTYEYTLNEFPVDGAEIELPIVPVQSIEYITYVDTTGVTQTWTDYEADVDSEPTVIRPELDTNYPATKDVLNAIKVRFIAGYQAADEYGSYVPATLKLAMKLLISHWNENREAVIVGTISSELPIAVRALLVPYRHWSFL